METQDILKAIKQERTEKNKMIGVFMGDYEMGAKVSFKLSCTPDHFKYHSDWNLLIPVYSKIQLTCRNEDNDMSPSELALYVSDDEIYILQDAFENAVFENRIDLAFDAVTTFLTWYNKKS